MNSRVPFTIGAALILPVLFHAARSAQAGNAPAPAAAPQQESAAKPPANPAKDAGGNQPAPAPTKLVCKAVRNDIGMLEPLRFITVTIDFPKKYVKMVHEGDGKVFEFTDGPGNNHFVKITDDSVVYGQGRETWRIDRYTGTMTSSAFTIQFECQIRPAERKF
jgi:hypothetical protein